MENELPPLLVELFVEDVQLEDVLPEPMGGPPQTPLFALFRDFRFDCAAFDCAEFDVAAEAEDRPPL